MKLFFTSVFVLSCAIFSPPVSGTAQEQPAAQSLTQERDKRTAVILEKLSEKAAQYRENHTLLLRMIHTKWQYFKADLTTPKSKPVEFNSESLVIRRALPDRPSEGGLFVIGKWKEVGGQEVKRPDGSPKEIKAHPFVSELDFLLAEEQNQYQFSYGGQMEIEGRKVDVLNFVPVKYEAPKVIKEKGKKHFTAAPRKGRILVDAESHDVRQIEWSLIDNYELHVGAGIARKGIFFITHPGRDLKWEKWDSTLKFKKYDHPDLSREFWLPESYESVWFVRGARKPVNKASTRYDYKRFKTGVRVIDDANIVIDKEDEEEPESN